MNLNIKLLTDTAKAPTRGSANAAGYDLYADLKESVSILPGECVMISTGIATSFDSNYFSAIYPRSGIAVKRGLRLANDVAVIDADYRGEWFIPLYNDSNKIQTIEPQERIAQAIFQPYIAPSISIVEDLDTTKRGKGGFGSTGTK